MGTSDAPVTHWALLWCLAKLPHPQTVRVMRTVSVCAGMSERPKEADCKSAGLRLRRFESFSRHGRPSV